MQQKKAKQNTDDKLNEPPWMFLTRKNQLEIFRGGGLTSERPRGKSYTATSPH